MDPSQSVRPDEVTQPPLLRVAAITKSFPGVLALQDVSLEVYPGEVLGLVGENGALLADSDGLSVKRNAE